MNSGYIAILDSGIGGFSALIETAKQLSGEKFLYFGDNKNAPYGNKTLAKLCALTTKNLSEILKYDVKAVIAGCNTLSLSVLPLIAGNYSVPLFGVFPPVGKIRGKTFLFATPLTCSFLKTNLKTSANATGGVEIFPLKNLAADIEKHKYGLQFIDIKNHLPVNTRSLAGAKPDALILGCTHYFFVKKQFIDHFCPRNVYSGEETTAKRVAKFMSENRLCTNNQDFTVDFIGENAEENYNFYNSVVKEMIFSR